MSMRIARTQRADRADIWVQCPWSSESYAFASTAMVNDYPTHSTVLGPDGKPLEYEARESPGFVLRGQKPQQ